MAKKTENASKESVVEPVATPVDPFVEKVSDWLRDAHACKAVLDRGDAVSPSEVVRLMAQAIPVIERLRGDSQG